MLFTSLWAKAWAGSLSFLGRKFQQQIIGMDRWEAKTLLSESWHGSNCVEISDETFAIRRQGDLESFIFYFVSPQGIHGNVEHFIIQSPEELPNIILYVDHESRNFAKLKENQKLTRIEKQFCKRLLKEGAFIESRRPEERRHV